MVEVMLQLLSTASALFICWLFVQAGIHKLNSNNDLYFTSLFSEYGLSDNTIAKLIIKLVALFELGVAIAIVFPQTRSAAAMVAAVLLFAYLLNMAFQLYQGKKDLDCGCSGPAGGLKISGHLRNLLLIGITLFCLNPAAGSVVNAWLLALLLAIVAILVHQSVEQLIGNAQKLKALRT